MKIKPPKPQVSKIKMKTRASGDLMNRGLLKEWWKADDAHLAAELCGTVAYLKTNQQYRLRQLAASVRLYSGLSVYSYAGSNVSQMDRTKTLPDDRPTFNLISSCVDTIVSRVCQDKPEPKFLTDNADYRQRHLAKQLNQFILGEFYQVKAYDKVTMMFRDGCVMGPGALKVYGEAVTEGGEGKVKVDRVMATDLYTDENDSINGEPQTLYQLKLMDRDKLLSRSGQDKKLKAIIEGTPQSYPDNTPDSGRTTADQVLIAEGWKLPSGDDPKAPGYIPGRHTLATVNGVIFDEAWNKPKFPFVFFNYSEPFLGFWGKGIGTRQFGNQLSLNRLLYTIHQSILLTGVPRVYIEANSKVSKANFNNQIGVIVPYQGTMPKIEVSQCNSPELYQERDSIIQRAFQEEGISFMQATAQKPLGLDSGEAIRSYDDISTDRMATISQNHSDIFVDLAYHVTDCAIDIAKKDGKYQTVYPNKDGTKEIDLPAMKFLQDPFVIQCFNESSLPRTPAGRMATVTEQVQAGMLTIKEGRRLLRFPDLEQNERLDNASEERIFKILDAIVEDGKYEAPDAFLDLQLAMQLTVQYINLYLAANLEEKKADLLRLFFQQCQALIQAATPPPMPAPAPQAGPEAAPTSPLVPNSPNPAGAAA